MDCWEWVPDRAHLGPSMNWLWLHVGPTMAPYVAHNINSKTTSGSQKEPSSAPVWLAHLGPSLAHWPNLDWAHMGCRGWTQNDAHFGPIWGHQGLAGWAVFFCVRTLCCDSVGGDMWYCCVPWRVKTILYSENGPVE
jgi:hypothetical protein